MAGQDFRDVYKQRYARPNENWECGLASEGRACPLGPTPRGKCGGHYECVPVQIDGRWRCTRPDQFGGPCDAPGAPAPGFGPSVHDGAGVCCRPVSCAPVRTLRSKRGVAVRLVLVATAAFLLLGLGGAWRDRFLSPGPLTTHHQGASFGAQERLLFAERAPVGEENCNACHAALTNGVTSLFRASLGAENRGAQSVLCLTCHENIAARPLAPHGLSQAQVEALTAQAKPTGGPEKPGALTMAAMAPSLEGAARQEQLACATCHQEHNGQLHDLTRLSDAQCQVCHVEQFLSFEAGHPAFSSVANGDTYSYPALRRNRIIYDHARHENVHFKEESSPPVCSDCHLFDTAGEAERLGSFEQMCARCHDSDIAESRADALAVFGYPSVDTETLADADIEIEGWPEMALGAKRPLSPFTIFFVSQDPDYAEGGPAAARKQFDEDLARLRALPEGLNFSDLFDVEDKADLAAIERLLRAVVRLHATSENAETEAPETVLSARLRAALDVSESKPLLGGLATSLDPERAENSGPGWHAEVDGPALRERSWQGLIAKIDAYAAAEAALKETPNEAGQALLAWFADFDQFRAWADGLVRFTAEGWKARGSGLSLRDSDWVDALGALPAFAALAKAEEGTVPAPALAFRDWLGNLQSVTSWASGALKLSDDGWYAAGPAETVLYRPTAHADAFVVEWLDALGPEYPVNPAAALVWDAVAGRADPVASPGACSKCHTSGLVTTPSGADRLQTHWRARKTGRGFTRFAHMPHLALMQCAECHPYPEAPALDGAMAYADSFHEADSPALSLDASRFTSSFAPVERSNCVRCHTREKAGNSCLLCHNYHVRLE